ncbi:MAG: methylated-DNA--[protein]-cysteine S-methyltransferase [Tepidanaerobacteraceae bacterium]|nr:methylated-DNA--[protein]-cysteine S-methyltransferase [Tepidanaerobacteraceae bacterium]HQE06440.1 methylated-DNA--[protein]-cysteine S-methyltransferase [Tepidanaerobacteraceae bacterium]
METSTIYWSYLHWKGKKMHLAASPKGLCCILWPSEPFEALEKWVRQQFPKASLVQSQEKLALYAKQIEAYLNGQRKSFDIPLDLRGTDFQRAVWQALLEIPYGTTKAYSEIAERIKRPRAVRAVGAAIGANPVPIVVPCHRVIGKDGSLRGFAGGLDIKQQLLKIEGTLSE